MNTQNDTETGLAEREFVIARDFAVPAARVFAAWTEAEQIARWWGPKGYANVVGEMDVRPGGAYRITMVAPDGERYPLKGEYREVAEPERLVMTDVWDEHPAEWQDLLREFHEGEGVPAQEALNTVTFDERTGTTTLTIRSLFESRAVRDAMVKMGMNDGWSESLDRLAELLAKG
jgi:uncharacterized protein YndB with AHSA1/START domain